MKSRHLWALGAAMLFAVSSASAFQGPSKPVDLTGTWTGTFTSITTTGEKDDDPAHLVLIQKGSELTGTGGQSPTRQMPIENGKVTTVKDVTTVTFSVTDDDAKIAFDLKLVDGRLKGAAKAVVDGKTLSAVLDVGRAK